MSNRPHDPRPFKSFSLFGQDYRVELRDDLAETQEAVGLTHYGPGLIELQKPCDRFTSNYQTITFWHEVVHAVLHAIGREKLNKDEAFVDLMGRGIAQVLQTGKRPNSR